MQPMRHAVALALAGISSVSTIGCEDRAAVAPGARAGQERLKRLGRRVGGPRALEPAPGGGELGAGTAKAEADPEGPPPLSSGTALDGGEAADTHRVLYCPTGSNAPLRDLWFTFSDRDVVGDADCWAGRSDSYLWTVTDRPPSADCAVGWTGIVTSDIDNAFAGVGAELADRNLSAYQAVALRVRGDGVKVRFEAGFGPQLSAVERNDCDDENLDLHGITFACGDGSMDWKELTLSFSDFRQQGWGVAHEPTWGAVEKVQMRVMEAPLVPDASRPARHPARTIAGQRTDGFECDFEVVGLIPR